MKGALGLKANNLREWTFVDLQVTDCGNARLIFDACGNRASMIASRCEIGLS